MFTGRVPFPDDKVSAVVMKKILDGERPPRPKKGKKLGLSDEFWRIVEYSLAQRAEERPSVSAFVDFLEGATPDITVLEELTKFDAESGEHVQELRHMLGYGDNTLLGMQETETIVVIEVFDQVNLLAHHPSYLSSASDLVCFQVLNSLLTDSTLRSQCLHGLQKVSARCGFLPKSYWISLSDTAEPDGASPDAGRVSGTRQRLMGGKLVAVKVIGSDRIENPDIFKRVRLLPPLSKIYLADVVFRSCSHRNCAPMGSGGSGWSIQT